MEFGKVKLSKSSSRMPALEFGFGKHAVEVEQRACPSRAHRSPAIGADVRCCCFKALKMQECLHSPSQRHRDQAAVAIFDRRLVGTLKFAWPSAERPWAQSILAATSSARAVTAGE